MLLTQAHFTSHLDGPQTPDLVIHIKYHGRSKLSMMTLDLGPCHEDWCSIALWGDHIRIRCSADESNRFVECSQTLTGVRSWQLCMVGFISSPKVRVNDPEMRRKTAWLQKHVLRTTSNTVAMNGMQVQVTPKFTHVSTGSSIKHVLFFHHSSHASPLHCPHDP